MLPMPTRFQIVKFNQKKSCAQTFSVAGPEAEVSFSFLVLALCRFSFAVPVLVLCLLSLVTYITPFHRDPHLLGSLSNSFIR